MVSASSYNPGNWILDSGATHHLTTDLNNLALHQPYAGGEEVTIADGSGLPISHTGSTSLTTNSRNFNLNDVLYVPNLHKNLISVYRLCNTNNVSVEFFPAHFQVKDLSTGVRLLQGKTKDELYEWPVSPQNTISLFASPTPKTSLASWHSRLGHPSLSVLQSLVSQFSLPLLSTSEKENHCSHCLINKSHKLPFHSNTITSKKPLQYIYTDVWSSPVLSVDQFKYYLVFVDHYTRYTWLYPLKQKSQVQDVFTRFKPLVENRFGTKIQNLYSDNGGEFIALRNFLSVHGITHLTSPPHTPEHNGVAERKHRHIVETGLALLHQASMPTSYWTYAFATAVYLINRLPSPVIGNVSPYLKLFQTPPNYNKLRVFGSLCYPWLRPYTKHKLESRSLPCIFLGYSLTQSAYLCLHVPTGRIYTSRHVQFVESQFPFLTFAPQQSTSEEATSSAFIPPTRVPFSRTPLVQTSSPPPPGPDPHHPEQHPPVLSQSHGDNIAGTNSTDSVVGVVQVQAEIGPILQTTNPEPVPPLQSNPPVTTNPEPIPPSQSNPPVPATSSTSNTHPMRTRAKNQITKPKNKLSLLTIKPESQPTIPTTVTQAMKDSNWRGSMGEEYNAQIRNHTFELVPPQPNQHVITTKWIHTLKHYPDGSLRKYKSRWVARGFKQEYGVDYAETFSPVVKSLTIRLILQLAVTNSWSIQQLDVNNAFLHGTLTDEVYVTQPPGFVDPDKPHHVCRLKKALYGLKQAPRAWYRELKGFLTDMGCHNSLADTSVFIYIRGPHIVYVLVYVDDIIVNRGF